MLEWSLQQTYYLVASLVGLIATGLNIVMYRRGRPDQVKAKVSEAVKPFEDRLDSLEDDMAEAKAERKEVGIKHDAALRALDHEVNGRLREMNLKFDAQLERLNAQIAAQSNTLAAIAAQLQHGVTRRDIDTLHHRVTEMAKSVAENNGVVEGLNTMVHNIEDFLRENGRG